MAMAQCEFFNVMPNTSEAVEAESLSLCSDADLDVRVKNTFISIACVTANSLHGLRRLKTFPLRRADADDCVSVATEISTAECSEVSSEVSSEESCEYSSEDSELDDQINEEDMPDFDLTTPWAYPEEDLHADACNADASSQPSFSLPCSTVVPLWQAMYVSISYPQAVIMPEELTEQVPVVNRQVQEQHHLMCECIDGSFQVMWHVEKRQLASSDKQISSPSFLISIGEGLPEVSCKLVLHAQGSSFQKARGHAHVSIKCETMLPETASPDPVSARFIVGTGRKQQPARGPVLHNFADGATCSLPEEEADWDMRASVFKASKTVAVRVEISPMGVCGNVVSQ